jgi:hypothetical protein
VSALIFSLYIVFVPCAADPMLNQDTLAAVKRA